MKKFAISGSLLVALGLFLILKGNLWGALVMLAGVGVIFFVYAKLMRGSGFDPDQATINGLYGQGKQQPDAVKVAQPIVGEQSADIWNQLENKK